MELQQKEYRLSRLSRLDFHGAIHIVHVRGRDGFNIFFDRAILALAGAQRRQGVPHLLRFLQLLDECCSECGAQLFGYCVEPNECTFVLRHLGARLVARLYAAYGEGAIRVTCTMRACCREERVPVRHTV